MNPDTRDDPELDTEPPANQGLRLLALFILAVPIAALLWVSSYSKEEPAYAGFPFFFWYQFAWIFVTSGLTWVAYKLVQKARPRRPIDRPRQRPGESWRDR